MDRTVEALRRVKAYCEAYLEPKRILFVSGIFSQLRHAMHEFERLAGRENCRINHATREIWYLGHTIKFALITHERDTEQYRGHRYGILEGTFDEGSFVPAKAYSQLLPLVRQ